MICSFSTDDNNDPHRRQLQHSGNDAGDNNGDLATNYGTVASRSARKRALRTCWAYSCGCCACVTSCPAIAFVLQCFATVSLLVFGSTNLDLPLGLLSKVPEKWGLISGIAGLISSIGAVCVIIDSLQSLYLLENLITLVEALTGSTSGINRLSVIRVLSYVWIVLAGQSAFSTIMAFTAVKAWRVEKRYAYKCSLK